MSAETKRTTSGGPLPLAVNESLGSWHVGVAAEAFAAAQFARCGIDVSVQYGANQPEYDLIISRGEQLLKVSVKGSQDGGWGLTQSRMKDGDYHAAIRSWLARHARRTVLCFVQFKGIAVSELPRLYLAWPWEVAARMHETARGRGDTILYESHVWGPKAHGAGEVEKVPEGWRFTRDRVLELLAGAERLPGVIPDDLLEQLEAEFHQLIRTRAPAGGLEVPRELPSLRELVAGGEYEAWFPISGMYGGFAYRLEGSGRSARLIVSSWSRVVGGSGQKHEIDVTGVHLVDEGFG